MDPEHGQTVSLWAATAAGYVTEKLEEDGTAEVVVIGAGMAGLCTAYDLLRAGCAVMVLEKSVVGGGETGRTTAHLSNQLDASYLTIEQLHGTAGAALAFESHTAAINHIEEIIHQEHIECDFSRVDGYLFNDPDQPLDLEEELAAAHRAGMVEAVLVPESPIPGATRGPCLCIPNQGQMHAMRFLNGLAQAIHQRGGRIYTGTTATKVEAVPGQTDTIAVQTAAGPAVSARAVVVATNTPFIDITMMHNKLAPYRTYAIGAPVPRGSVPPALLWDTGQPYHYVRVQPLDAATDVLIIGGEDHKTGQAADAMDRFHRLETWSLPRFPTISEIRYRWSGQVVESSDGLAYIGRNPGDAPSIFIVTGDCGMGMTHGAIAGSLLTDLILGRDNRFARLYDPARTPLASTGHWLRENLNAALQFKDYLTGGDVASEQELAPGQGAIIRHGLTKAAVFRDSSGIVHQLSPVCPHLKCMVQWNPVESSWDCPCHGSRFDAAGHLLNGPATADLTPLQPETQESGEDTG